MPPLSADVPTLGDRSAADGAPLQTGRAIGPYRLVRELGRRGADVVWLADDERLARRVALKVAGAGDAAARARFLDAARASAALEHPHVARVLDVGEGPDGRPYLARAYYARGAVSEHLGDGPLPPAEAARIAAEVAEALAAAHARGLVHGAVEPATVLLDAASAARLADFAVRDDEASDAYRAPERRAGHPADARTDLWGLGATLHAMLGGTAPGAASPDAPVAPAGDPRHALAALAAELRADDPAARGASARDAAAALRALWRALDDAAPRATPPAAMAALAAARDVAVPESLTSFVGRARELAETTRLLADARLLTLVGPGGSGKTRLAAALAAAAPASGVTRVTWVELAVLADARLVPAQIATALRVPERPDHPPLLAVADAVGETPLLLVLDNCEHLVDACAAAADLLLRRCPRARVLATSREALGVPGETAWPVPPLVDDEARQLFVERARAALPGFAVTPEHAAAIDEICRRLDGIPLAVELAAARVRALTPTQIAERLDDAFRLLTGGSRTALARQRTLRGTMEWSHALLGPRDRVLLRRLAVFAGGFALEAAEAVCVDAVGDAPDASPDAADRLDEPAVLDGLMSLVDKSLVTMDAAGAEPRYRLLETVRQYARERLDAAGERAAYEAAHARHFLALAETSAPYLMGGERVPGLVARLRRDDDNLHAALRWALGADGAPAHPPEALRFADALFWYWYTSAGAFGTSHPRPARAFVEAALAIGGDAPAPLRGRALRTAAMIDLWQGGTPASDAYFTESIALLRGHAGPGELAYMLAFHAIGRLALGDVPAATRLIGEAEALSDPLPTDMVHGFVRSWRGMLALATGDLARARASFADALRIAEVIGSPTSTAHSLTWLARVALHEGRLDEAAAGFVAAAERHVVVNDPWGLNLDVNGLVQVAHLRGRPADAARLLGGGEALRERTVTSELAPERAAREAVAEQVRAALGAAYDALHVEGRALSSEGLLALARRLVASDDAPGTTSPGTTSPGMPSPGMP